MGKVYVAGEIGFIVENNLRVKKVVVLQTQGEFYVVKYLDGNSGMMLRGSSLYKTQEEAEKIIPKKVTPARRYRLPYEAGL